MANILNIDFIDFIVSLEKYNVKYMIVGGYAVIYHGYNRTTGDLDIWVDRTSENYNLLLKAFADFGMSMMGITLEKFLNLSEYDVFTFGRPPVCIELLTAVKGLNFEDAYSHSSVVNFDGISVRMIDIRDLIVAKTSAGRSKDMDDLEHIS